MNKILAKNRKAFHDYEIIEMIEAGIELIGCEVKSIKANKVQLAEGYAHYENNEIYLYIHVSQFEQSHMSDYNADRKRKLLLHKEQIVHLANEIERKKLTLIPLQFYLKNGKIKVEIALCRGLKKYDKREKITKKEVIKQMKGFTCGNVK